MNSDNFTEVLAKGSSGNSYAVRINFNEDGISVSCSCPAGSYHRLCKHIKKVLAGDVSILSQNKQEKTIMEIYSRLQKTSIPLLLAELNEAEALLEKAQKRTKRAKVALERVVSIK
jgi:uncharacterized Zn finger protein